MRTLDARPGSTTAFADQGCALAMLGRSAEARAVADLDRLLGVSHLEPLPGFDDAVAFNGTLERALRTSPSAACSPT